MEITINDDKPAVPYGVNRIGLQPEIDDVRRFAHPLANGGVRISATYKTPFSAGGETEVFLILDPEVLDFIQSMR